MDQKYKDFFRGKKITLMGLGLLGRGVGDAEFLASCGAELTVTDLKSEEDLAESLRRLEPFKNVRFVLGRHDMADFRSCDMVIKAAGVPLDSQFIAEARRNHLPVEMDASLFAKLTNATLVGVTGTRGKSTTTALIYRILEAAGKRAFLGGNVRGIATLPLLAEADTGDIAVLELDSWQLQGFGDANLSPHVAVFTTFFPDHMNYYKGSMDRYLEDKANIFKYQTAGDFLILGEQAAGIVLPRFGREIKSAVRIAKAVDVPKDWELLIPGAHNRANIAAAIAAAEVLGVPSDKSREAVESFAGVPGRLEFLREVLGVKIYNDTTATTPEATIAALEALGKGRNAVLIMGGSDKGLDMTALMREIKHFCRAVILLSGTGTARVADDVRKLKDVEVLEAQTLARALENGMKSAHGGDVLIFSPAFASFGMFKNEFDRGDQFRSLVAAI